MRLLSSIKSAFKDPHVRQLVLLGLFFGSVFLFVSAYQKSDVPFAKTHSDDYIPLAISLYERHAFSYSTTSPYVPEVAHAPGYPMFLAVTAAPWDNVYPALLIQLFLLVAAGVILYRLFEGIFSPRVRFWGSLIFIIEPFTLFTATQPLSEPLFLFLFLSALLCIRRSIERYRVDFLLYAGLLMGAATLVRPILEYLAILSVVVLAVAMVFLRKRAVISTLMYLLGILIILVPWGYRNAEAFGVWTLSTKGPYTLYFFNATEVLKYAEGISGTAAHDALFQKAQDRFPEVREDYDLRSPVYAPFLTETALEIISEHRGMFAKMYLTSIGTYFLSDGYRLLWEGISGENFSRPNITRAIATGDWGAIWDYVSSERLQIGLFLTGVLFWGLMTLGAFLAPLFAWSKKNRLQLIIALMSVAIMMYFAILTGPVALARYRIVVTPFLFVLAFYSLETIISWWKGRALRAKA